MKSRNCLIAAGIILSMVLLALFTALVLAACIMPRVTTAFEEQAYGTLKNAAGLLAVSLEQSADAGGNDVDIRRDLFRAFSAASMPILLMRSHDLSLEEIFLNLTTGEE